METTTVTKSPRIINVSNLKKFALAEGTKLYPYERVSASFISEAEEKLRQLLLAMVHNHPKKGKTLLATKGESADVVTTEETPPVSDLT